jgi:hypothetical protein
VVVNPNIQPQAGRASSDDPAGLLSAHLRPRRPVMSATAYAPISALSPALTGQRRCCTELGVWGQLYMGENGPARMCIAPKNGIFPARLRDVDDRSVSRIELSSGVAPAALIRRLRP